MNEPVVTCVEVRKRYKAKTALDGVNLAVPRGCVLGLLGLNGAGKTTLIKSLMGLVRFEGDITLLETTPAHLDAATKERIGYVPQEITLYGWMRVGQLADYVGSFYTRWNEALVRRLLEEWGLALQDKVGTLSTGQAQKLAIILALGHEPELLVLDEPAASLDPSARRQFLRAILDVVGAGDRTVLFSTHLTSDLERVADRVAIIKSGKTLLSEDLGELKDRMGLNLEDIFLKLHQPDGR